jgi:membrane protease YdiL (CAAX protease family)
MNHYPLNAQISEPSPRGKVITEIILFVIVTYGLNFILLNTARFFSISPSAMNFLFTWGALLQMWIPGLTSLVFRLVFKRGFHDIGWKTGNVKFWLFSILIPFSVPLISYLIAFLFLGASINLVNIATVIYQDPIKLVTLTWPTGFPHSVGLDLFVRSLVVITIGLAFSFVMAFGEELGWRGYLQQRIVETGFRFPHALCGLIWAGWHLPFLWYYLNPSTSISMQGFIFTLNIICLGIISGHLREDSGSIWIPTMLHAAHNTINFELFAAVIVCRNCELLVGENGILMGIIYGLIAISYLSAVGAKHPVCINGCKN